MRGKTNTPRWPSVFGRGKGAWTKHGAAGRHPDAFARHQGWGGVKCNRASWGDGRRAMPGGDKLPGYQPKPRLHPTHLPEAAASRLLRAPLQPPRPSPGRRLLIGAGQHSRSPRRGPGEKLSGAGNRNNKLGSATCTSAGRRGSGQGSSHLIGSCADQREPLLRAKLGRR